MALASSNSELPAKASSRGATTPSRPFANDPKLTPPSCERNTPSPPLNCVTKSVWSSIGSQATSPTVWFPVQPVEVQVTPLSVVRKRPPDAKLSHADTYKVCGSVGEAHNRGPRKNSGSPLEESNQDAPPSVERSAPPMLSPDSLFQDATIF